MSTTQERALVPIPLALAREIDAVAGSRRRSAFVVDLVEEELRRQRLLKALDDAAGCWKDEDHPELAQGGAAWVRGMRKQGNVRINRIRKRNAKK
jgi:hypothetical protein